jgi:hypothetical protein
LRNPAHGGARGFFWFYFVNEHFLRFLKKRFSADYDTVPLWLFWGLMLVWLMPWTAFLVQAIRQVPAKLATFREGLSAQQRATLVFALWPLIILLFFSFSSRQEYYVLPGLPGVALLLGGWLASESASAPDSAERRSGRISSIVLVVAGVAVCVACVALAWQAKTPPPDYDIAELLKKNPQDYALSFGHFLDLTPQAMELLSFRCWQPGLLLLWHGAESDVAAEKPRVRGHNMALVSMTRWCCAAGSSPRPAVDFRRYFRRRC